MLLLRGLHLAISLGEGAIEVESDSLVFVSDVNGKAKVFDNYGLLLLGIWNSFLWLM